MSSCTDRDVGLHRAKRSVSSLITALVLGKSPEELTVPEAESGNIGDV